MGRDINTTRVNRVIDFIETLTIPEGMDEGKPFILRHWQKDIIRRVYGPAKEDGLRLVRKSIYSVGKKNGKSPFCAAIVLCHLIGPESKRNEQIYSAAFEKEQAALTFNYARKMVEYDEELKELTIIRTTKKEIEGRYTGSMYKALAAEAKSKHGISPAVLIFDELAQFGAEREYFDTLIQGFGAHAEPLLWIISTQAADDLAILSQEIDYALKHPEDKTVELFLFTADTHDETGNDIDLMDVENWRKANPALGDFLSFADMESLAKMAVEMPSYENGFRNLRLNQRISATARFMSPGVWKRNGGVQNPDSLFKGRITAGLDLSGKNDLSFLVLDALYEKEHNIFSHCWTPLDNIKDRQKRDRVDYPLWVKQGYLNGVPGKTIHHAYIAQQINELHALYGIDELRFDRWRIEDLQREFENIGYETYIKDKEEPPTDTALCLVPYGQGYKDINKAIESIEDAFIEGKARHNMHPVLLMCASNAVTQTDPAGNRKFEKHKSNGRIDGIVAMAMAMSMAETPELEDDNEVAMPIFL